MRARARARVRARARARAWGSAAALAAAALARAQAIVGGDAFLNAGIPPWFANLYTQGAYDKDEGPGLKEGECGGSLVNDKCVITAAHCFVDSEEEGFKKLTTAGIPDSERRMHVLNYSHRVFAQNLAPPVPGIPTCEVKILENGQLEDVPCKDLPPPGTAVQPRDKNVGAIKWRGGQKIQMRIGGADKVVSGTPYLHPYWFKAYSHHGICTGKKREKCQNDYRCVWLKSDHTECNPEEIQNGKCDEDAKKNKAKCELKGGSINIQFNDIAVVRLDAAPPKTGTENWVNLFSAADPEKSVGLSSYASTVIGQ